MDDHSDSSANESKQEDDHVRLHVSSSFDLERQLGHIQANRDTGKKLFVGIDDRHHTYSLDSVHVRDFLGRAVELLRNVNVVVIFGHDDNDYDDGRAPLPVSLLISLFTNLSQRGNKVVSILLKDLDISGSWGDFQDLARSISLLPSLETVFLQAICASAPNGVAALPASEEQSLFEPMAEALSKLPYLANLQIDGCGDAAALPLKTSTLLRLCQSPCLRSLLLYPFLLSDEDATQVPHAMETNLSLKKLYLHVTLTSGSANALARMVECNPALESLHLCTQYKGEDLVGEVDPPSLEHLMRERVMLNQLKTSLEGLENQLGEMVRLELVELVERQRAACVGTKRQYVRMKAAIDTHFAEREAMEDKGNIQLVEAVGKSNLVHFRLKGGLMSLATRKAFRLMASEQYSLRSLRLYSTNESPSLEKDPAIALYCKLNSVGRGKLLQDQSLEGSRMPVTTMDERDNRRSNVATENLLIDTLAQVNDDLDCLYYLLRAKPSVICKTATVQDGKRRHEAPVEAPPSKRTRLS